MKKFLQAIVTKHLAIVLFVANLFKQFLANFTIYKAMNMFVAKLIIGAFSLMLIVFISTSNLKAQSSIEQFFYVRGLL